MKLSAIQSLKFTFLENVGKVLKLYIDIIGQEFYFFSVFNLPQINARVHDMGSHSITDTYLKKFGMQVWVVTSHFVLFILETISTNTTTTTHFLPSSQKNNVVC